MGELVKRAPNTRSNEDLTGKVVCDKSRGMSWNSNRPEGLKILPLVKPMIA